MGLNFQGELIVQKRTNNLASRKTTGVRVSCLSKGQKVITIGADVLAEMGLTDLGEGIKVKVTKGSGVIWGGKIMVQPAEDGTMTLRYVNSKKKSAGSVMSSALPFEFSAKTKYKVYPEDKALVFIAPTADEKPAKAEGDAPAADAKAEGEGGGEDASFE